MQENKEELETPTANEEQAVESEIDTEENDDDDVEFDDGAKETETKETNRNNAKLRIERKKAREQKRLEEENRIRQEARIEGFKEASNNVNRFTGEALETDEDIDAYKLMLEIDKDGGDPIEDFYKYQVQKQRAARIEREKVERERQEAIAKENQAKQQKQDFINQDILNFNSKYPEVKIADVINNNDFMELFGDDVGNKPLGDLYEKFNKIQGRIQKAKTDKIIQDKAVEMSSTGALGNNANPPSISFSSMTREERKAWREKNIKSY